METEKELHPVQPEEEPNNLELVDYLTMLAELEHR